MTTPWSIKLNKPWRIVLIDTVFEIGIAQHNHIFFISRARLFWASRLASGWLWTNPFISNLSILPKNKINDSFSISLSIIITHFTINDKLNGWISLNSNINFLTISINGSNFSNTFQCFSCFFIFRGKIFTMTTPWGIELYKPYSFVDFIKIFGS